MANHQTERINRLNNINEDPESSSLKLVKRGGTTKSVDHINAMAEQAQNIGPGPSGLQETHSLMMVPKKTSLHLQPYHSIASIETRRLTMGPPNSHVLAGLRIRERYGHNFGYQFQFSKRNIVKRFYSCEKSITPKISLQRSTPVPPYVCAYSHGVGNEGKYLAIADEEGSVLIVDTTAENMGLEGTAEDRYEWSAHSNAVFEICWTQDDKHIVTASGDRCARLWDIETRKSICAMGGGPNAGHGSSLKTVAQNPHDPNVFVTAGRDGHILVWDVRCTGALEGTAEEPDYRQRPVDQISNAHAPLSHPAVGFPQPRRKSALASTKASSNAQSVTALQFLTHSEHALASTGAADGLIKFWDVRKKNFYRKSGDTTAIPVPVASSSPPKHRKRDFGLASLTLDPTGTKLFSACMDNSIHEYSTLSLGAPVRIYSAAT
ncbi:hypothetical protein HDU76_012356, partial [Blyttiomyces sp. JEL0837]